MRLLRADTSPSNVPPDSRYSRYSVPAMAGFRSGSYDPVRNLYLPAGASTGRLRAACGKAASGGLVNLVCIGDSKTAGLNVGPNIAYPSRLRNLIAGVPSAGTGLVPTAHVTGLTDSRWSSSGVWTDGYLYSFAQVVGASKTFTSDVPGTVVEVYYFNTTSPLSVSIDGGATQTITGTGAASIAKQTYSGLANTTHTVAITTTSASNSFLVGVCVRQTSGLLIHNFGCSGSGTVTWVDNAFPKPAFIAAAISADIMILEIGTNDAGTDVALSTFATNLATITSRWSSAARIITVQTPRLNKPWSDYVSGLYDRADGDGIPLLDLTDRWGTPANGLALGVLGSDQLHESAAGHLDKARAYGSLF